MHSEFSTRALNPAEDGAALMEIACDLRNASQAWCDGHLASLEDPYLLAQAIAFHLTRLNAYVLLTRYGEWEPAPSAPTLHEKDCASDPVVTAGFLGRLWRQR